MAFIRKNNVTPSYLLDTLYVHDVLMKKHCKLSDILINCMAREYKKKLINIRNAPLLV